HEAEGGIHLVAHHGDRDLVALRNGSPVFDSGASHGIDTELEVRGAQRVQPYDVGQIADIRVHEVVTPGGGGPTRPVEWDSLHPPQLVREQLVGPVLHPTGDLSIGGTA